MDVTVETLERSARIPSESIRGLSSEDLSRPTPCADWDVRALLSHLVMGNVMSAARLSHGELPDPNSDFLGDDPSAAYEASVRDMVTAFRREGVLDETFQHRFLGNRTGQELLRIRVMDSIAHGWDLAAALDHPRDREPELYQQVLEYARPMVASLGSSGNEHFAAPQEAPDGASPADQYAALLGRRVPT